MSRLLMGMAASFGAVAVLALATASAAAAEPKVGEKAPNFSLVGSDGKTYNLSDFKGKSAVVLAWFPKAFTGGCTKECKSFAEGGKALRGLNVAYFTASVDEPDYNKKFAESLSCDYPILSDPDKSVAKAYGVVHPGSSRSRAVDVLHRQGRDRAGRREEDQRVKRRRRSGRQAQGAGHRQQSEVPETRLAGLDPVRPQSTRWARALFCSCTRAQRYFSSPRIFQKSRLCIRPGTRPQARAENENGSVYSR